MNKIIKFCIILLIVLLSLACTSAIVEVPVQKSIERGIEVNGLENKFVYITGVGFFGGAGAGGIGAPVIYVDSSQQFINLIPENEPIYVSFGYDTYSDGTIKTWRCGFTYWAFLENRAGLIQYQEMYDGILLFPRLSSYQLKCLGLKKDVIEFKLDSPSLTTIKMAEEEGYKVIIDE